MAGVRHIYNSSSNVHLCHLHSSLHHQGAYASVKAGLMQVHSFVRQHHPATPAAHLSEQGDGRQRELLEVENTGLGSHRAPQRAEDMSRGEETLTCPAVWMDRKLQSEDRKPMASVLGYSPSSRMYMFSVNWDPSYATQLTCSMKSKYAVYLMKPCKNVTSCYEFGTFAVLFSAFLTPHNFMSTEDNHMTSSPIKTHF